MGLTMNISDQELWIVFQAHEREYKRGHGISPRGNALERIMASTLEHRGLPANPENMARMRDVFLTREFGMQM